MKRNGEKRLKGKKTSNIELRIPSVSGAIRYSTFDVGCSMFLGLNGASPLNLNFCSLRGEGEDRIAPLAKLVLVASCARRTCRFPIQLPGGEHHLTLRWAANGMRKPPVPPSD